MDFSHEQHFTAKKAGGIGVVIVAHVLLAGAVIYGLHSTIVTHQEQPPVRILPEEPTVKVKQNETMPTVDIKKQPITIEKPVPIEDKWSEKSQTPPGIGPGPDTKTAGGETPAGGGGIGTDAPPKQVVHTSNPVITDLELCKPSYTAAQIKSEEEGTTRLRLDIGSNGSLTGASILKSSGYADLDRAAVRALSKCSFKAATQDGVPVQSSLVTDYVWALGQ